MEDNDPDDNRTATPPRVSDGVAAANATFTAYVDSVAGTVLATPEQARRFAVESLRWWQALTPRDRTAIAAMLLLDRLAGRPSNPAVTVLPAAYAGLLLPGNQ